MPASISLAAACATPALASPGVALDSAVYVERSQPGAGRILEPAQQLNRGDRVVTVVTWRRSSGNSPFVVVNPLPRHLAYQSKARDEAEVSVDGGRNWGQIGSLQVGDRMATPEDVTHLRWQVRPGQPDQRHGRIAYSGIVR